MSDNAGRPLESGDDADPAGEKGSTEGAATRVPRSLLVAAVIVGLEAVAVVGLGVAALLNAHSTTAGLGITNGIFFILYGAGIGFAAWGFSKARRWSRSPVVLTQVIQLGVAYSFAGNNTVGVAVILSTLAIPVLVIAFLPSTTTALFGTRDAEGDDRTG